MGFYAQLDLLGRLNGKWESSALSDAAYVDPVSATLNQLNPAMMIANSIKNVEVGSQVYGRDRSNLIEAQMISMAKTGVKVVGAVIATVGNILAPGVALAVGTAIMALADTIQVDTQTGKRSMKMTEQQAYGIAANVVPGGMLFTLGAQYDEKGRYTGNWQINDDSLTMGIKQGISSALATVPGGAVIAEGINVAMDTSIQHYKYQQGHQNNYIAMTTVGVEGMNRFGEAVGTTIGKDVIGPSASPGADSNLPDGSEKGLWDIFGGAADWMRRKSEMLDGYLNPIKLLAKGLDAVGADSAGNLLRGRGYNSNEELFKQDWNRNRLVDAADFAKKGAHQEAVQSILNMDADDNTKQTLINQLYGEQPLSLNAALYQMSNAAAKDGRYGSQGDIGAAKSRAEWVAMENALKERANANGGQLSTADMVRVARDHGIDLSYMLSRQGMAGGRQLATYDGELMADRNVANGLKMSVYDLRALASEKGVSVPVMAQQIQAATASRKSQQSASTVSLITPFNRERVGRGLRESYRRAISAVRDLLGDTAFTLTGGVNAELTTGVGAQISAGPYWQNDWSKFDGTIASLVKVVDFGDYLSISDTEGLAAGAGLGIQLLPGIGSREALEAAQITQYSAGYGPGGTLLLVGNDHGFELPDWTGAKEPVVPGLAPGVKGVFFGASRSGPGIDYQMYDFERISTYGEMSGAVSGGYLLAGLSPNKMQAWSKLDRLRKPLYNAIDTVEKRITRLWDTAWSIEDDGIDDTPMPMNQPWR